MVPRMKHHIMQFTQALLSVDRVRTKEMSREITRDMSALSFVDSVLVPSLESIGTEWERGDIALSQVYMSGRICEDLLEALLPDQDTPMRDHPRAAVTVLDDYHMLGKQIVASVLRGSGYVVQDFQRTTVETLLRLVAREGIEVLFVSVLMLPSALRIKDLVQGISELGLEVKVIVGGAPFRFDPQLWREVGAFGWGRTASEAVHYLQTIKGNAA
jgi:methanogenic corrinoid protein MtbC1